MTTSFKLEVLNDILHCNMLYFQFRMGFLKNYIKMNNLLQIDSLPPKVEMLLSTVANGISYIPVGISNLFQCWESFLYLNTLSQRKQSIIWRKKNIPTILSACNFFRWLYQFVPRYHLYWAHFSARIDQSWQYFAMQFSYSFQRLSKTYNNLLTSCLANRSLHQRTFEGSIIILLRHVFCHSFTKYVIWYLIWPQIYEIDVESIRSYLLSRIRTSRVDENYNNAILI